jgi:hypothetical protein
VDHARRMGRQVACLLPVRNCMLGPDNARSKQATAGSHLAALAHVQQAEHALPRATRAVVEKCAGRGRYIAQGRVARAVQAGIRPVTHLIVDLLVCARQRHLLCEVVAGLDQLLALGPVVKGAGDIHLGGGVFPSSREISRSWWELLGFWVRVSGGDTGAGSGLSGTTTTAPPSSGEMPERMPLPDCGAWM